jgi:molybdopterin synthase sulfur carrier subunit
MEITAGTIILINGKNIYHLDMLNSIVKDNDVVALFPPGAGG